MKQYVVDELRFGDYEKLKAYLDEVLEAAGIDGLYWKPIDTDLLTPIQTTHSECAPFFFTLVLAPESLTCELLVRTKNKPRCDCMGYATTAQRNWLMDWSDAVFRKLCIID